MDRPPNLKPLVSTLALVSLSSTSLFMAKTTAEAGRKQTAPAKASASEGDGGASSSSNKISSDLLRRLRQSQAGSHDTVRVIFNVPGSTPATTASSVLRRLGAGSRNSWMP